jgi:tRNA-dihydrouridine synthase
VFGNGDVKSPADAIRMFEESGVDGVMIGRAALHNPFIFRDIHAYVSGAPLVGNEVEHRIDAMQRYLAKIDAAPQVEKWKLHKARTVIGWFSKGIAHGKDLRTGLQDMTSVADARRLLDEARESIAA